MAFDRGELVWAAIAFRDREGQPQSKVRPALVLAVREDGVVVAWGTSTTRDPSVKVESATRLGLAWGLRNDTWFYERNVALVAVADVRPYSPARRGPMKTVEQIYELVLPALERFAL